MATECGPHPWPPAPYAVNDGVPETDHGRRHVDLQSKGVGPFWVLARLHLLEEAEVLFPVGTPTLLPAPLQAPHKGNTRKGDLCVCVCGEGILCGE